MKKLITLLLVLTGAVCTASADSYQVAGDAILFGDTWTEHELTDTDGDGLFTFTTTATLAANTDYEYKYKTNHGYWGGDNLKFKVQSAGTYKLTFSIDVNNSFATNAYGILKPTTVTFVGNNITSSDWASTEANFTADGDSWTFQIDETIDNVYFRFKVDDTEYQPYKADNKDYTFNFTNGMTYEIKTWGNFQGSEKAFVLPSFNPTKYSRYIVKITPYFDNIFMQVTAYEKATTNASGYCTYVNTNPITISEATAYGAEDSGSGNATAHAITTTVPANTPMLIKGDVSTTYYFAVASEGTALGYTNAFKEGPVTGLATEDNGKFNYILNDDAFYEANGKNVAAGKAYLQLSAKATARALIFEDEDITGISAVTAAMNDANGFYNLQGVKVANPTKGLYIHNGKKYVVK